MFLDERSKNLEEANEKCFQLQELLNSKEAEVSNDKIYMFILRHECRCYSFRSENEFSLLWNYIYPPRLMIRPSPSVCLTSWR